jgi:hypothetical protein
MPKLLSYNFIYLIPLFFSAIFSLNSFRLKWSEKYKVFSIFLLASFAIELFAISWKWHLYKTDYWIFAKSNLWVYNLFLLIRFSVYTYFFYNLLESPFIKKAIRFFYIPLILLGILNYFLFETPHKVDNMAIIIVHIIVTILCLIFFREVLKAKTLITLTKHPAIWISLGAFLYHSATLPFFIFLNYLIKVNPTLAISCLNINQALNIIMYSLFFISFLCNPQFQK